MIKLKSLLLNEESLRPEDLCLTSAGKKIEDFNDLNLKCKEKFFNWAVAERSSTVNINYGWDSSTQLYQVMSSSAGKKNLIHCYGMFKTAFYGDFGLKLQDDGTMGLDDTIRSLHMRPCAVIQTKNRLNSRMEHINVWINVSLDL